MNEQLLIRFLQQECTAEELRAIEKWLQDSPDNSSWLFEMERLWGLKKEIRFSEEKEIRMAYNQFVSRHPEARLPSRMTRKRCLSYCSYAAAVIIIAFLATNLYNIRKESRIISQRMNVIEVPKGQRSTITLTDGTKIWLNAGSRLVYPAVFSGGRRNVVLEGEGFFEVTHNEKSPFVVQTTLVEVTVLGTKFNIEAYPEETVFVTLAEGKVQVLANENKEQVILNPNDQAIYSREIGLNMKHNVDAGIIQTWTVGELSYVNKTLSYITKDLQRRFNVEIVILDKELQKETFNSRVYGTATIEKVLDLLKETRRLDYRKNNDRYEIYKHKKELPME